jgi:DNA-binding CsgD family transcriptional regulator
VILSRGSELSALDELVAGVRAGRGGALVVRGEPGIGKTTLLTAIAERDDVTVLRARGVETEAELAFSALSDLLSPVASTLGALPAPQSAALAAALALGPPAPGDRLAVCVATVGLLTSAAPALALVDDLHWLDAASRECVLYAARRAADAGFGLVLASREAAPDGLPELALGPLDRDAAFELLKRRAGDLAPSVAAALVDAAAGNPLALVELPGTLTAGQRSGAAEIELPIAPGRRMLAAYAGRLGELDHAARQALLVAAAHTGTDLATLSACSDVQRLTQAEDRGLVGIDATDVRFAHPIIRGAVYHGAAPGERRRAHRALAGALDGERRAWHLAAATIGCDEDVARELERAARAAASRRGFASAAAAFERAARLSPDPHASARRLLAAGQAAGAAGAPDRALALLEEAAGDDGLHARAVHARCRIMVWAGEPADATRALIDGAAHAGDPVLAATMLADAANGCTATNAYHRAEELAERAVELLGDRGEPAARGAVLTMLGWTLVLRGRARRAREVLRQAEAIAVGFDPLGPHWPWLHLILRVRVPLEEFERARRDGLALADRAREAGALATLGSGLIVAADAAFRLGDWATAGDATREAMRVAGETGQQAWHGYALTTHARLASARGEEAQARDAVATALNIAEASGISSGLRFVHGAHGFLELSLERVPEAVAALEAAERLVAGSGHEEPTLVPWLPDLIEAYARDGDAGGARRILAMLERQALRTGTAFPAAAAARCRGMLEDDFDAEFEEALRQHDRRPMPFERARTLLAYGRRLHRVRRRAEARDTLREALRAFESLGASAWSEQAQHELRAAGGRRRARDGGLTPQEQRVVAAVRRGASNREVAAELFLAPKTVEFHLRQIYRKVGVRSRTQLVALLADEPMAAPRGEPQPRR